MNEIYRKMGKYLRWTFLSALSGLLSGMAATVFLVFLQSVTQTRDANPWLISFLPLAGLAIGATYHHFGREANEGHGLILEEIHEPKNQLPFRMAPLILFGTIFTHLFGGSAGREGTAVQIGASLSDQLSSFFRIEADERKILLVAGAGAGFGATIGAPWAGAIFGMEVIHIGKLRLFAWFECLVASSVAYWVTLMAGAPHTLYPRIQNVDYAWKTFFVIIIFGALCGLMARGFVSLTHGIENSFKRRITYPPLIPFIAGILLVVFYRIEGSYHYVGLGLPFIHEAFSKPSDWNVPLLKGFSTALTVGSGFKGGEFVPLVFMGTTLGSTLSILFKVSTPLLASLGFAAVFAGAANTPIACSLMAMELFGPEIGGYAVVACFLSYYFSGSTGIYGKSQKRHPTEAK